jgi:hypothetical protein
MSVVPVHVAVAVNGYGNGYVNANVNADIGCLTTRPNEVAEHV